jgi:hypothetical protein
MASPGNITPMYITSRAMAVLFLLGAAASCPLSHSGAAGNARVHSVQVVAAAPMGLHIDE